MLKPGSAGVVQVSCLLLACAVFVRRVSLYLHCSDWPTLPGGKSTAAHALRKKLKTCAASTWNSLREEISEGVWSVFDQTDGMQLHQRMPQPILLTAAGDSRTHLLSIFPHIHHFFPSSSTSHFHSTAFTFLIDRSILLLISGSGSLQNKFWSWS